MKIVLVCMALADALATGCTTTQPAPIQRAFTPDDTLVVNGLSCPLCAHNIDKQLLAIAGVEKAQVHLGTGEVYVKYGEPRPERSVLVKAVEDSGFTLKGFK